MSYVRLPNAGQRRRVRGSLQRAPARLPCRPATSSAAERHDGRAARTFPRGASLASLFTTADLLDKALCGRETAELAADALLAIS